MKILKGDTVKITKPLMENRGLVGRTGTVTSVDEWNESCRVDITWDASEDSGWKTQGVLASFLFDELDLVESANEREQIEKMAQVLLEEGKFPSSSSALETAAILYKAGCRHEG